jgi:hypothetical protein
LTWTAPRTWAVGEIATATNMNTHVRDNLSAVAGTDNAQCRVYNSAAISIANFTTTYTALTFNTERRDVQGCHSTSVNTGRITVPTGWGGLWSIGACVSWAANATGWRAVALRLNGATIIAMQAGTNAGSGIETIQTVNTEYPLSAADYVEVIVGQTSGGNLNVAASANYSPEFWARWLSV